MERMCLPREGPWSVEITHGLRTRPSGADLHGSRQDRVTVGDDSLHFLPILLSDPFSSVAEGRVRSPWGISSLDPAESFMVEGRTTTRPRSVPPASRRRSRSSAD